MPTPNRCSFMLAAALLLLLAGPLATQPVTAQRGKAAAPADQPAEDAPAAEKENEPEAAPETPVPASFQISGQIRQRSERNDRQVFPDREVPLVHLLRTRLNVSFTPAEDVNVFVQVQDARMWGGTDGALGRGTLDGNAPALDFHQAYFLISDLYGTPVSLKVGRQELAYGNERLIGSVGFSNVGRTFDAAVVKAASERATLDVFGARLVGRANTSASQNLFGAYGSWNTAGAHHADAFVLLDDDTEKLTGGPDEGRPALARYTVGSYLHGTAAPLDYALEFAYQGGKIAAPEPDARRVAIRAYLASGALGVTLGRLHLSGLYTRLSGDATPGDGKTTTFNTLFATNHKFYGFMDYFPATYTAYGLQDFALSGRLSLSPAVALQAAVHHFALDKPAPLQAEARQALGQELDLDATVRYNAHFSFVVGTSFFATDDLMKEATGKDLATWVYLTTLVHF